MRTLGDKSETFQTKSTTRKRAKRKRKILKLAPEQQETHSSKRQFEIVDGIFTTDISISKQKAKMEHWQRLEKLNSLVGKYTSENMKENKEAKDALQKTMQEARLKALEERALTRFE